MFQLCVLSVCWCVKNRQEHIGQKKYKIPYLSSIADGTLVKYVIVSKCNNGDMRIRKWHRGEKVAYK